MIGLATIGQSPRDDVVQSMFGCADHPLVLEAGALDGLNTSRIHDLAPQGDEHPLVTRLGDHSEVVISKPRIIPFLNTAIARLEESGAALICVLCTGSFQKLHSRRPIIYPDAILTSVVDAILPTGRLGAIIPHYGQLEHMRQKWETTERPTHFSVVSPYDAQGSFAEATRTLATAGVDLIVMDCMGYDGSMQQHVQASTANPVILANRSIGALLASMLPGLDGRR